MSVANGFGVLSSTTNNNSNSSNRSNQSPTDVLTTSCSTRRSPLASQRVFAVAFPKLKDQMKGSAAHLLALCKLVSMSPKQVVISSIEIVVPVLVVALGCSQSQDVVTEALVGLQLVTADSHTLLEPHLSSVIPLLLQAATGCRHASGRVNALKCLHTFTKLSYPRLHPFRSVVARGLHPCLDDKKRVVRRRAVQVRNDWMVL